MSHPWLWVLLFVSSLFRDCFCYTEDRLSVAPCVCVYNGHPSAWSGGCRRQGQTHEGLVPSDLGGSPLIWVTPQLSPWSGACSVGLSQGTTVQLTGAELLCPIQGCSFHWDGFGGGWDHSHPRPDTEPRGWASASWRLQGRMRAVQV